MRLPWTGKAGGRVHSRRLTPEEAQAERSVWWKRMSIHFLPTGLAAVGLPGLGPTSATHYPVPAESYPLQGKVNLLRGSDVYM